MPMSSLSSPDQSISLNQNCIRRFQFHFIRCSVCFFELFRLQSFHLKVFRNFTSNQFCFFFVEFFICFVVCTFSAVFFFLSLVSNASQLLVRFLLSIIIFLSYQSYFILRVFFCVASRGKQHFNEVKNVRRETERERERNKKRAKSTVMQYWIEN